MGETAASAERAARGMTVAAFQALLEDHIPLGRTFGVRVEEMADGRAVLRLPYSDMLVRPGATISGPPMMTIADMAMYGALLSLDAGAETAVTSTFTMNFLRAPRQIDLVATGSVIRMGRRLIYLETYIHGAGDPAPVAHVTGTYTRRG